MCKLRLEALNVKEKKGYENESSPSKKTLAYGKGGLCSLCTKRFYRGEMADKVRAAKKGRFDRGSKNSRRRVFLLLGDVGLKAPLSGGQEEGERRHNDNRDVIRICLN